MQSVTDSLSLTYEAQASSVAEARAAVTQFAKRAGATPTQIDGVRLATSEAVTNAVVHAYHGRSGKVHVTAALAGYELWLLIADDGEGLRPRADCPGLGLGLGLIAQVCDEMAIVARSSGGTEVRVRFDLSAAEPATNDGGAVAPGQLSVNTPAPHVAAIRAAPPTD
jgi:serine/threonine-protein kinase RsbW